MLTPPGGADPYLQFVASVMGTLSGSGRQPAIDARTPHELYHVLTRGPHRPANSEG